MHGEKFSDKLYQLIEQDNSNKELKVFTGIAEEDTYLTTYSSGNDIFDNFTNDKVEKLIGILSLFKDKSTHEILMNLIQKRDVLITSTARESLLSNGLIEVEGDEVKITQKGTLFYLSLYSTSFHL